MDPCILCSLVASDIIGLIDILVTSIFGVWIVIIVQNNVTKNRYLKEFYINELRYIGDSYKEFIREMYDGHHSSKHIKDWLKIMSGRISSFNDCVQKSYVLNDSLLPDKHSDIQRFITNCDEFNENYKEDQLHCHSDTKTEILRKNYELSNVIMQRVIDINNAKKRRGKTKVS